MSAIVINDINVNFEVANERVFISSLELGEVFKKNHAHVLRTINNLLDDEFKSQNFIKHSYLDKTGRVLPCYNLTRDGFSLLVMGFTGEKAYKWKVEFIKAFNLMEAKLKRQSVSRYTNQINGYKSQIAQHNNEITELKNKLSQSNKKKIDLATHIVFSADPEYNDALKELQNLKDDMINLQYRLNEATKQLISSLKYP
ncbi:Rha family transcriptional regulator [Campylobacter gastrosuis]|uniref:Rha family transcriptional regulator n=1 Tax=Campylobacter gastrosuis TaxID=2974576 RepID=A0ABT7HNJ9_9BACT|nr:Rha family transcriptional regulator [Campylobacter gastrosuis]MDL0088483.1 Rha family transcriptional regulator [Campylobacter gastrosuis]